MLLGLQKRHDFLETLATLQVSIHDDICFKAALLFLFYGVRQCALKGASHSGQETSTR